jgi:ubiquinone/menaquinone biosynthesis C-methylase UbiE
MLAQAKAKLSLRERNVTLIQGDAQSLPPAAGQFDAALLNLVLSVVPDAAGCFSEALRCLRPDARAVIFDKFLPDESRLTLWRKLFNLITMLFGTDITRRFSDLAAGNRYVKLLDEPSLLHGAYRIILVRSY